MTHAAADAEPRRTRTSAAGPRPVVVPRPDRRAQLVAAARLLLEAEGVEAVTVRRLGAALGIKGPSIYKHVTDKAVVISALVSEGLGDLADVLAGVPATFYRVAEAYRQWAQEHPHLHRLINHHQLDRSALPPELEERAAAPLLTACAGDRDLARAAWATIIGLVDLELAGRFPPDADIAAAYTAAARAYEHPRLRSSGR